MRMLSVWRSWPSPGLVLVESCQRWQLPPLLHCVWHLPLPTAGHWLSGTAAPHLLETTNPNRADVSASQSRLREMFGVARDNPQQPAVLFFYRFVKEKKVVENEEKMIGGVKGNEACREGWWRREGQCGKGVHQAHTHKKINLIVRKLGKKGFEMAAGTLRLEG